VGEEAPMKYHIVVRKFVRPDTSKKYEAQILDETDTPFVAYTFDGDSRAEAVGKAIIQHPELFPDLVVER
jgi:hypothetical protein